MYADICSLPIVRYDFFQAGQRGRKYLPRLCGCILNKTTQSLFISEGSVNFLCNMKQWGITSEAKIIDLLLWDAQKRDNSHHYRSITDLLAFFFKYQDKGHPSKQVFSNGAIVDYDGDGFISSSAIAINSRIVENAVLMELEQALISLKKTVSIKEEDTDG